MTTQCSRCKAENPDESKFYHERGLQLDSDDQIAAPTTTLEALREELTIGSIFAERYQIIEELGKGGMGTVYRVEESKIGQEIALKPIKLEIAPYKITIERFRNELKTTRMISHINVCRMFHLYDHGH